MKSSFKKKLISFTFVIAMAGVFMFGMNGVSAATLASYNFSGSANAFGGLYTKMDYLQGQEADYVKVTIKANDGDNYDLRLVYSYDWVSNRKVLAQKTGIKAKGSNNTFYFIPQNGKCPGSSSQCIKVPVVSKISDKNHAVSYYDVLYGIEVYNGSLLGGAVKVSGSYSFNNY